MDKVERERLVADAILLERAAGVLERRERAAVLTEPTAHAVLGLLRSLSANYRRAAGREN